MHLDLVRDPREQEAPRERSLVHDGDGEGGPCESGPIRAVHMSRHEWPGGLVNYDSGWLSGNTCLFENCRGHSASRVVGAGHGGHGGHLVG